MPEHNVITDPELHEPKGVAAATVDKVYLSDGAGSGDWVSQKYHFGGYIPFDSATPAYQHSLTTSDTVFDPTFTQTHAEGFTSTASPNARMTYVGIPDVHCATILTVSSQQSSGSGKDVEMVLYLNGTAQESSRVIRTASSAAWGSTTLLWDGVLSTNDYLEFFLKGSATATLDVASSHVVISATATL